MTLPSRISYLTSAMQQLFIQRYGAAKCRKCGNDLEVDKNFYINRRSTGGNKHYHIDCAKLVHLI